MTGQTVMLLIDADNVSMDVIEQAVPWVARHFGGPHVRRAYCTAESAVKHQAAFKRLSIRPMVNLAAGKNSTDIALAVDALDLAVSERPQVVVIASSDSDFAPLVSRLREKGCRVVGIGQQGKTGDETRAVYDDYEVLEHRKGEPRAGSRTEPRAGSRSGSRSGSRAGSRAEPRVDSRAEPRAEPKAEPRAEPRAGSEPEPGPLATAKPKPRPARKRSRKAEADKPLAQPVASPAAPAPPPAPAAEPAAEPAADKPARKSRRRRGGGGGGGGKRGEAAVPG